MIRTRLRALSSRLRRLAATVDGLPYSYIARRSAVNAELLVSKIARQSPHPFAFVQVGSNDGQYGDPLHSTLMRTDVRGLLIEPVPELFERLTATYAGKPGLSFVQAAVAEQDGRRDFYWVPPTPADPPWADQLGSFNRDVVLSHAHDIPDIASRVQTISVTCRTLSSLVHEAGLLRIDLLHIDAEGFDLAILKTIDFGAGWAPRHVLYEQKHLGSAAPTAIKLLHRWGYHTLDLGPDVFGYRGLGARVRSRLRPVVRLNTTPTKKI